MRVQYQKYFPDVYDMALCLLFCFSIVYKIKNMNENECHNMFCVYIYVVTADCIHVYIE